MPRRRRQVPHQPALRGPLFALARRQGFRGPLHRLSAPSFPLIPVVHRKFTLSVSVRPFCWAGKLLGQTPHPHHPGGSPPSTEMRLTSSSASGSPTPPVGNNAEICLLPLDDGPCRARIPSYYYDRYTQSCREFMYGGCEGNANNFETLEACNEACWKIESKCSLPLPELQYCGREGLSGK